jgi:hypothetical protein
VKGQPQTPEEMIRKLRSTRIGEDLFQSMMVEHDTQQQSAEEQEGLSDGDLY